MAKTYYFANWKMYQSFDAIKNFIQFYQKQRLSTLEDMVYVGIAPSYEHLYFVQEAFKSENLFIGAQDCSHHMQGAYTGQVSIQSLVEMQLSFCIIGHSEVRKYLDQTNQEIFLKFKMLIAGGISPILAIGETLQQKHAGQTLQVLWDQLDAVLEFLQMYQGELPIFIAYEPVYAIGTGLIPTQQELREVFYFLDNLVQQLPMKKNIHLLYGGSVSEKTVLELKSIKNIAGFLIGKAGIDFQDLKKIVES